VELDVAIPPRRFGRALRAARRAAGLRRTAAAARLGVTPRLLADWERGTFRVPATHHETLVALYGEHLTARVPARRVVRVEPHRVVVGSRVRILAGRAHHHVLPAYAELLTAVRGAKPGSQPALRASDLEVLAAELGQDVGDVEARIVSLLGCTNSEAATLHAELRRRALVPAAGLAVAITAWAGALAATQPGVEGGAAPETKTISAGETHTSAPAAPRASTTTAPAPRTTTPSAPAGAPTSTPQSAAPTAPTAPTASTASTSPPAPTLPPGNEGPGYESTTATAEEDDPPVSILPGEVPIIVQP
jgi:hypothetical protein